MSEPRERDPSPGSMAAVQDSATPLLWTGGWDSTFRLLMLLIVERRFVQPYYVIDDARRRRSIPEERAAMRHIRDAIAARYPEAASRLRDTIECERTDIAPDPAIQRHYEECLKHRVIGGQYEWLARFCKQRGLEGVEMAIHGDDKARLLLGELLDNSGGVLDSKFAGDPRYELFRFFRFSLSDSTKKGMRDEAHELGFDEIMMLTWFCHQPRHGQPCGTCTPCIQTLEEGLGDRIPPAGRLRYRLRVVPRLRWWLASSPRLYGMARALYRQAHGVRAHKS